MSVAITLEDCTALSTLIPNLEGRLNENQAKIKELGMQIVDTRNFSISSAKKQTIAKYICTYKNWMLTIKDKAFVDQPEGVLGIYEIECMNTGEVYKTHCNLKGSNIDKKRFVHLKGIMDNGVAAYLAKLTHLLETMEEMFMQAGLWTVSNIQPDIQSSEGQMFIEKGDYQLFLKLIENEEGEQSLSISNGKNWSNARQNTTLVKGDLFPLQGLDIEEVTMYVMNFFKELETGKLNTAIPIHLFKQGYSWINN